MKNFSKTHKPTAQDWEQYLKESHDQHPGITVDKITRYPTLTGCSSYELLANKLDTLSAHAQTLVDLACGDGPLTKICLDKIASDGKILLLRTMNL